MIEKCALQILIHVKNEHGQCSLTLVDQTSPVVRYLTRTSHHVSEDDDLTGNGPVLTLNHK